MKRSKEASNHDATTNTAMSVEIGNDESKRDDDERATPTVSSRTSSQTTSKHEIAAAEQANVTQPAAEESENEPQINTTPELSAEEKLLKLLEQECNLSSISSDQEDEASEDGTEARKSTATIAAPETSNDEDLVASCSLTDDETEASNKHKFDVEKAILAKYAPLIKPCRVRIGRLPLEVINRFSMSSSQSSTQNDQQAEEMDKRLRNLMNINSILAYKKPKNKNADETDLGKQSLIFLLLVLQV